MRLSRLWIPRRGWALVASLTCLLTPNSHAQVVAPSTYVTSIQVQGEDAGTEFDDWDAAAVPIAITDELDNPGVVDINTVQIANDDEFIYLRVTYHGNESAGTFLAFDTDQDNFTGFDVFSRGEIGAELGYSNDFAFQQDVGVFNTGDGLTNGPLGNGGSLIFPSFSTNGPSKEYAIGLDTAFTNPAAPAFSGNSFDFMVYSDQGATDVTELISYTLATAPVVPGDFNANGSIDAADYTTFRDNLGTTFDLNGNGDEAGSSAGTVDEADYNLWVANFGSGLNNVAVAVPEPKSIALLAVAMLGLLCRKRAER